MNITKYAMIVLVAMASIGAFAAMQASLSEEAYADGDHPKPCDSSDEPPFKDFPDASGPTGNPHTCQQPTGDPHDDEDNPPTGNPHNTE
jgi:hypothetical protein